MCSLGLRTGKNARIRSPVRTNLGAYCSAGTNLQSLSSRVIARSAATRQSLAGSNEFAGGFPVFRLVLRDCHALLRKARNDKSGVHADLTAACFFRQCLPEIATASSGPRNDKLGGLLPSEGRIDKLASASLPCHCEEGVSPTRQTQVSTCEFADGFPMFRLRAARLPRLLRSLAMTNLGVFLIRRGAMTNLGVCRIRRGAMTSLGAFRPPGVCFRRLTILRIPDIVIK